MSTWAALVMYVDVSTYEPYHPVERHGLSTTICPGADAMDPIRLPLGLRLVPKAAGQGRLAAR